MINLKRIYETAVPQDGYRVLVDRLWPRGISKERARLDLWLRDIAPTTSLRQWFAHDPAKWEEFRERYLTELKSNTAPLQILTDLIQGHTNLTLLYAARDPLHNEAVILKDLLISYT